MTKSKIAWTDRVWNPISGCTKVSAGCAHCYAETLDHRFDHDKVGKLPWALPASRGGRPVTLHPDRLDAPLRWRKPAMVFVNSMSDLFHEDVPDEFIAETFYTMRLASHHTFQVLTKRPERMTEWVNAWDQLKPDRTKPFRAPNIWLGVSVENQYWADRRIPLLLATPAAVRFLSCEPLLKKLDVSRYLRCPDCMGSGKDILAAWPEPQGDCDRCGGSGVAIHWVIIGGESGSKARPMELGWATDLLRQCRDAEIPAFFKQTGVVLAKELGLADRNGRDITELPPELRVLEMPWDEVPEPSLNEGNSL